jgi:ribose-phosphate pyrophosphokinase
MECKLNPDDVRIFSGRSHPELAASIAFHLGIPLEATHFSRFSNDNLYIQLGASVRSRSVFIVQSLIPPVSEHLLELLMMLDIARGAGAKEIHAIIPYFSYARSDKKNAPRISITARLIADLLETAGATHVMTDPLTARGIFVSYLRDLQQIIKFDNTDTVVVAPDYGRAGSAARLAHHFNLSSISAEKNRISDTQVQIGDLISKQVAGFSRAIIYDDEIATGGSVITLSRYLVNSGVNDIFTVCTHGLFFRDALQQMLAIPQISHIITTDTVPIPLQKRPKNMAVLSVAPLIADAIFRNYTRQSIGPLFDFGEED